MTEWVPIVVPRYGAQVGYETKTVYVETGLRDEGFGPFQAFLVLIACYAVVLVCCVVPWERLWAWAAPVREDVSWWFRGEAE